MPNAVQRIPEDTTHGTGAQAKPRIFIVEDERIVALHISSQLHQLGYEIAGTAASSAAAVTSILGTRPDIVLMDINIEGEADGIETVRRLQARMSVPVIYLTAYSEPKTLERAKLTAPFGYLMKPFSERDLHATIQMALARHKSESALVRNEARLRGLAEMAADWHWETDREGRFTGFRVTGEAAAIVPEPHMPGRTRLELVGDQMTVAQRAEYNSFLAARRRFREFRFAWTAPDGSRVDTSLSGDPVYDADGEFAGYAGIGQDVTRRTGQERMLERERAYYGMLVKSKAELLSNAIHEFRTPLNAIMGYAEALRDAHLPGATDESRRTYAARIHEAARYMQAAADEVLDFARIEARRGILREEYADLGALLRDVAGIVSILAQKAGIEIALDPGPPLPQLWLDPLRVRQIAMNLLSNAVKYSGPGTRVTAGVGRAPDGRVVLTVADRGRGMGPEQIARAFEPFASLPAGGAAGIPSSGLGLPMTKALVELHGGELELESVPGAGTTFRVWFPAGRCADRRPA
jgi:PAS domain S-box-containing protein